MEKLNPSEQMHIRQAIQFKIWQIRELGTPAEKACIPELARLQEKLRRAVYID